MNNEGWIYCGTNRNPDLEGYIKIGKSVNNASSRENNTNGAGYNIFFAIKVDDCEFYEQLIHKMFEEFNYQNNSTARRKKDNWQEWFNVKFENLLPFLLEIATDFEIRDEDYCTKICKTIKENGDFYKILIKREPNKFQKLNQEIKDNYGYCPLLDNMDFTQKEDKMNANKETIQQQKQNNDKPCKYETRWQNGWIDWNWFFEDNPQLVGKSVYPFKKNNEIGKLVKLKIPIRKQDFGVLYKGKEMTFNNFINENGGENRYNAYRHIYFQDTNKNINDTYHELKFK